MNSNFIDTPLEQPEQDLLGFSSHARRLAKFLDAADLPFILGIYGPWGAGKTSFANFLEHELRKRPGWSDLHFVTFSAWPYLTPDAIWQALVEKVAREICWPGSTPPSQTQSNVHMDWKSRLRRVLLADALTLTPARSDRAKECYERLVRRLNIAAGIASRTSTDRLGGLTVGRAIALVLDSAANLSPSIGPIRRIISGDGNNKGLLPSERPAPELVKSIEDIRGDLQELFSLVGATRFVVLLDDLDRCLPEVALDVLETVKIFFFESAINKMQGLFLVAADERLVARGLSARLGPEENGASSTSDARAYLEKIIQFGIPLPNVELTHAHKLVSTWAPDWVYTSDLIVQALDGNPRRVKQQSALLSYNFAALHNRTRMKSIHQATLSKLVRLHALRPNVLRALRLLDNGSEDLRQQILKHESMSADDCSFDPQTRLAKILRNDQEVFIAFQGAPLLSEVSTEDLKVIISIADGKPGPQGIPSAKDRAFSYIFRSLHAQHGATTIQRLAVIYARKLLALRQMSSDLAEMLTAEIDNGFKRYLTAVIGLEKWYRRALDDPTSRPSSRARELAKLCKPFLVDGSRRDTLMSAPLLSEIPLEFVRPVLLADIPAISVSSPLSSTSPLSEQDALTASAVAVVEKIGADGAFSSVQLRLELAHCLLERRKFAKVQLLLARWPELAELARGVGGSRRLRDLETSLLKLDPDVRVPAAWERFANDEKLREFLGMPPSLAEIHADELSQITATTTDASQPPSVDTGASFVDLPHGRLYRNVRLKARVLDEKEKDGWVRLQLNVSKEGEAPEVHVVQIPASDILRLVELLRMRAPGGEAGSLTRAESRIVSRDVFTVSPEEVLADIGAMMWNSTFGSSDALASVLVDALRGANSVRLVIEAEGSAESSAGGLSGGLAIGSLPWECLYIPSHRIYSGRTLKISVIREIMDPVTLVQPRMATPLRVLAIAPNPSEMPLPGIEQEIKILRQVLESAPIRLEVMNSPTKNSVQQALRKYLPHIIHFMGHGTVHNGMGYLMLLDDEGRPDFVNADKLGVMLQDSGILLAVLNGCATGSSEIKDLGRGVAQRLVRQGVPAAVATTRVILDDAALKFAAAFYQAFSDGYAVEASLVESRKALSISGFDWSAYVMYASLGFPLQEIRVTGRRTPGLD